MWTNPPRGRPGLGLLAFRLTTTAAIIMLHGGQSTFSRSSVLSLALVGLAVLIALGVVASISSGIAALVVIASLLVAGSDPTLTLTTAALCVSLSISGPGAYSIDGLIHGRRRIIVPKQRHS